MADTDPPRLAKNAPGDWYTTGECMACGAPEAEAPELLSPRDGDDLETYFVRQPATGHEVEHACRAAEVCCVSALRSGGHDPAIIQRLGNSGEYCDFVIDADGRLSPAPLWRLRPAPPPHQPWWRFWHRDPAS